jgi:NitT/TauT family transport system substrate-binding protein
MNDERHENEGLSFRHLNLSRRTILASAAVGVAGAGAGLLVGCGDDDDALDMEGPPEVTSVRISKPPPVCVAAQYIAEEFLYEEGFEEVLYVTQDTVGDIGPQTAAGDVDFAMNFAAPIAVGIDQGHDLSVLAGMHVGCFDLFVRDGITTAEGLRGKRLAVSAVGPNVGDYVFVAGILQYLGIDIHTEVKFVPGRQEESKSRLENGEVDAFLAFPPWAQELRAEGVGNILFSSAIDPPWNQYYCCLVTGNKDFIRRYPAATKRVVRSYIRAAEHCAEQPEVVADFLVSEGHMPNREYAGEMMRTLPYDVWRRFDADTSLTFYALQLHDAGVISSTPEEIIERGTDWRFLDALKEELAYRPRGSDRQFSFYCDPQTGAIVRRNEPAPAVRRRAT